MSTGYTRPIFEGDGLSFEEFVWRCARAIGHMGHQRDEDLDALPRLPGGGGSSTYHEGELAKAEARVSELVNLPPDEGVKRAEASFRDATAIWRAWVEKYAIEVTRLKVMEAAVEAWEPPTEDHAGLKTFMRQQLHLSVPCEPQDPPAGESAAEWQRAQLDAAQDDVTYHRNKLTVVAEGERESTKWVLALAAKVPPPNGFAEP